MRKSGHKGNDTKSSKNTEGSRSVAEEHYVSQPARFDAYEEPKLSAETSGLQPSQLLNHEAMTGKFSMQRILDTRLGSADNFRPERPVIQPKQDAIGLGLVSESIAEHLFKR